MIKKESRNNLRKIRQKRVRKIVSGTKDIPRLSVFRSNKYISVQIIDDISGKTLVSASSFDKDIKQTKNNIEVATLVGEAIAKKAKAKKVKKVVFDRGGYLYHGRVKALAEAARQNGLEF